MTMDFASARTKARQLLAPKRPQDLSASALKPDKLRDAIIRDAEKHTPRFKAAVDQTPVVKYKRKNVDTGEESEQEYTWHGFADCVRDCARALFGFDEPDLRDRKQVRPDAQLAWDVLRFMLNHEEFRKARAYARANEPEALFGAITFSDEMLTAASELLAEHVANSEDARAATDDVSKADQLLDKLRQSIRDQGGVPDKPTRKAVKDAYAAWIEAQQSLGAAMQAQAGSMQVPAAAAAARQASQKLAEAVEVMANLPGNEPGTERAVDPSTAMDMAEKILAKPHLVKMLRNVGRMIRDMQFQRETRVTDAAVEPVEIRTGDELDKLVPFELARAGGPPELQAGFVKDYSDEQLLQYEYEGRVPAGKGPIVEVIDCSGSMWEDRFVFASCMGIATATICQRERRTFAIVHYGAGAHEVKTWVFPDGKITAEEMIEVAEHFYGGGTHTWRGMAAAQEIIDQAGEFETADVLLVGDGCDAFGDKDKAIRERFVKDKVRVHGVSIMCPRDAYFKAMCDYVTPITDLVLDGPNDGTTAVAQNIT